MASRYMRKTVILAKVETTYGTDAVPTGASNALLVSNVSITPTYNNVNRDIVRDYLGGSEQLSGTRSIAMTFDVELSSSGTAGTAPAWGALLRGCGKAEAIFAGNRVEYTPVSSALESLTVYYYLDGLLHKVLGSKGNVMPKEGVGERPLFSFSFTGLDGGATAAANPSTTLTAWKTPTVITDQNTADVTFGGSYASGAVTGGTAYPSRGLSLDLGNTVTYIPLVGGEGVDITARASTGTVSLELTAAQEASFITDINANTLTSVSMLHGTVSGSKVLIFAPAVQRTNPKHEDLNGRAMFGMDLRLLPLAGNDELRIVAL